MLRLCTLLTILICSPSKPFAKAGLSGSVLKPSHSPTSPTSSSFSATEGDEFVTLLSKKVAIVANIPIFEFGQDVTDFLRRSEDDSGFINPSLLMDLEVVYYDYLSKLRSHYFLIFSNFQRAALSDGLEPIRVNLMKQKDYCVGLCKRAMQSAMPISDSVSSWSYEGPFQELESDIDASIEEVMSHLRSFDDRASIVKKRKPFFSVKFLKRSRWIAIQFLLLAVNFTQNEYRRRSSKHSADRRLAEVPEFPLL